MLSVRHASTFYDGADWRSIDHIRRCHTDRDLAGNDLNLNLDENIRNDSLADGSLYGDSDISILEKNAYSREAVCLFQVMDPDCHEQESSAARRGMALDDSNIILLYRVLK